MGNRNVLRRDSDVVNREGDAVPLTWVSNQVEVLEGHDAVFSCSCFAGQNTVVAGGDGGGNNSAVVARCDVVEQVAELKNRLGAQVASGGKTNWLSLYRQLDRRVVGDVEICRANRGEAAGLEVEGVVGQRCSNKLDAFEGGNTCRCSGRDGLG